jgi:hypothetical protein
VTGGALPLVCGAEPKRPIGPLRSAQVPVEGVHLRIPFLVAAASLVASAAAAADLQAPRITLTDVNWAEAALSLPADIKGAPEAEFAEINAQTQRRFPGIGNSSVPVLLPFDIDAFRAALAAGHPDALTSDRFFGPFQPSKFFLPGPAGYMATFYLQQGDGGFRVHFHRKPIQIDITGAGFTYDLDGPSHQEVFPLTNLQDKFPGIKRVLREAHVRYVFERFGVPYVVSIQCYDRPPSRHYLSCREADPIAEKFLSLLHTAGGTPQSIAQPQTDLSEPSAKSDFTYFSPGDLIPNTGWHKMPGRVDYHVYADMAFPIADPPAYVKSQSFMPWGDCYRTGHTGRWGRKDSHYACKVNDIPLVFDESAAVNFTYPWRDNFCEERDFRVGQCPGGIGHQGEDIRPSTCTLLNEGADRCEPYKATVAAVRDGMIWRTPGNLAAFIVVNTKNDFVRFRYLHMNPHFMDDDGLMSGRRVRQGEIIGKVGTWGDYKNGTSYHLNFSIQVFTKVGWVWVSPYMTLVRAYERRIDGRGTELKPGDPMPPVPDKQPLIENPPPVPLPPLTPQMSAEHMPEKSADADTPQIMKREPRPRRHKHKTIHRAHGGG